MDTNNESAKKWYNHWFCYLLILIIIIISVFAINCRINDLINERSTEVNKTIRQILLQQASSNLLLPNTVILTSKKTLDTSLDYTIRTQLARYLSNKYLSNQKDSSNIFNIQPYLNLSDTNSYLTKENIEQIKKHIEFLASTVDKAVEASRHDIDIEISRLNNWISIWIGVIGLLGIFIPLVLNIKSLDDFKKIKTETKRLKKNVSKYDKTFAELQPQMEQLNKLPETFAKINEHDEKINDQQKKLSEIRIQYSEIEIKAKEANILANNTEKLLTVFNSIYKLKDIDSNFLIYNNAPLITIVKILQEIFIELLQFQENYNQPIIKDGLRQLARSLYSLSYYPFLTRENIQIFVSFSVLITEKLEKGLDQTAYKFILSELESLINHFNK